MYGQGTYSADMQFRNDRTGELLSQARVDTLTMAKMLEYLQVQGHTQVLVRWQDMVSVLRDSLPQGESKGSGVSALQSALSITMENAHGLPLW